MQMTEIFKDVFVGNQEDFEDRVKGNEGWSVVHACKEPYHRIAVGYKGRACSKDNPEYLIAKRGDELMLNLIDTENPEWVSPLIIDEAMEFIGSALKNNKKVLVHCNQGQSRSAVIGLLFYTTGE